MWLEGRRRGMWCGGFPIPAARFASTYCFALRQDSRSCTPYKAGEEKELCLFKHFLISLRTEWRTLLINSLPPSFSNPVSREKEFFFPLNYDFKWLFPVSLLQVAQKKNQGPPCCHSGILNFRGQSPLFWRMVLALEWAEVQCLASLLTHLKISLTRLSSWNTFKRPFWKSWSHEAVPLLLSASACYQTNTLYQHTVPCNLAVFLRIAPFSSALWRSLIFSSK